jgi:hypothetical protein
VNRYDLEDDDVLLALLSESLDQVDPVPQEAVTAALAMAQLADADAELAKLVGDSLADHDVVLFRHDITREPLGEVADRLVTFATPQLTVDLDFEADGARVVGTLTPAQSVDVAMETRQGSASARSDQLGRFQLAIGPGPCRLRIHAHGGTIVTPWITR